MVQYLSSVYCLHNDLSAQFITCKSIQRKLLHFVYVKRHREVAIRGKKKIQNKLNAVRRELLQNEN